MRRQRAPPRPLRPDGAVQAARRRRKQQIHAHCGGTLAACLGCTQQRRRPARVAGGLSEPRRSVAPSQRGARQLHAARRGLQNMSRSRVGGDSDSDGDCVVSSFQEYAVAAPKPQTSNTREERARKHTATCSASVRERAPARRRAAAAGTTTLLAPSQLCPAAPPFAMAAPPTLGPGPFFSIDVECVVRRQRRQRAGRGAACVLVWRSRDGLRRATRATRRRPGRTTMRARWRRYRSSTRRGGGRDSHAAAGAPSEPPSLIADGAAAPESLR